MPLKKRPFEYKWVILVLSFLMVFFCCDLIVFRHNTFSVCSWEFDINVSSVNTANDTSHQSSNFAAEFAIS